MVLADPGAHCARRREFVILAALAAVAAFAGELTTMPTELACRVCAANDLLAAPPPQLLVLWQPLQSLPT